MKWVPVCSSPKNRKSWNTKQRRVPESHFPATMGRDGSTKKWYAMVTQHTSMSRRAVKASMQPSRKFHEQLLYYALDIAIQRHTQTFLWTQTISSPKRKNERWPSNTILVWKQSARNIITALERKHWSKAAMHFFHRWSKFDSLPNAKQNANKFM